MQAFLSRKAPKGTPEKGSFWLIANHSIYSRRKFIRLKEVSAERVPSGETQELLFIVCVKFIRLQKPSPRRLPCSLA